MSDNQKRKSLLERLTGEHAVLMSQLEKLAKAKTKSDKLQPIKEVILLKNKTIACVIKRDGLDISVLNSIIDNFLFETGKPIKEIHITNGVCVLCDDTDFNFFGKDEDNLQIK